MLKLVLFGALFALAAAAPQFPFYPGFYPYSPYTFSPFPYVRSPHDSPLPYAQHYYPYSLSPFIQSYNPFSPSGQQQNYNPFSQNAEKPAAPATVPAQTSAPVNDAVESTPARPQGELNIDSAKLYLTPEQQILFEAAVAAMNPLEYAAQLDSLTNPTPNVKAPSRTSAPAKDGIEIPVVTAQGAPLRTSVPTSAKGELSLESARLYLTPEQQVLFEAAVASMNPLEYAAKLDSLKNP